MDVLVVQQYLAEWKPFRWRNIKYSLCAVSKGPYDCTVTFWPMTVTQNFDGKSPLYRDRPPVRYFYVGKITEHLPENFDG